MKEDIRQKQRARKLALQALYQWDLSKTAPKEIETQNLAVSDLAKLDADYFAQVLHGVCDNIAMIDSDFTPFLDRPIEQLNPVECAILRLSTYELLYCPELPCRVILREAVLLAREFGSQDGYKYVNGVLNKLARQKRPYEMPQDDE